MNKVSISGYVSKRPKLRYSAGQRRFFCTFALAFANETEVIIYCDGPLGKEISRSLELYEPLTVMGKLDSNAEIGGLGIIADVILKGSDEVYPEAYPKQAALQERDRLERQEKLKRAAAEAEDDDDVPF